MLKFKKWHIDVEYELSYSMDYMVGVTMGIGSWMQRLVQFGQIYLFQGSTMLQLWGIYQLSSHPPTCELLRYDGSRKISLMKYSCWPNWMQGWCQDWQILHHHARYNAYIRWDMHRSTNQIERDINWEQHLLMDIFILTLYPVISLDQEAWWRGEIV